MLGRTLKDNTTIEKILVISEEVDKMTDGLGLPVDSSIKPSVIALHLWEFPTSASCQGHTDRGTQYPWVDIDCEFWNTKEFLSLDDDNNTTWQHYAIISKTENDKQLDRFQDLLIAYQKIPHVDCRDINIEYFGLFGGFRIRASSLEKMNEFADYLVRRYDFCSPPKQIPSVIYMEEKDFQDLLEWCKE